LAKTLLDVLKTEQTAKKILESSPSTGIQPWQVVSFILLGVLLGAGMIATGQSMVISVAFASAVVSLNLALACAAKTRRINQRFNALLTLNTATADRLNLQREISEAIK
jgi:hypothetical protein